MNTPPLRDVPSSDLIAQLSGAVAAPERAWLDERFQEALEASPGRIRVLFSQVARKLIATPTRVDAYGDDLVDRARIAMLVALSEHFESAEYAALVTSLYRTGEHREQRGVLRALPYLPEPALFLELAIESSRTNSLLVFSAMAAETPYPAALFPELHFNQLVLKSIFLGVAVERIEGLRPRITDELVRMVGEYARERVAAGRPVPSDVDLILAAHSER